MKLRIMNILFKIPFFKVENVKTQVSYEDEILKFTNL